MKAAERKKYYRAANRIVREQYLDGAIKNAENAENYQGRHRQMVALKVKGSRGLGYVFDPAQEIYFGRGLDTNDVCLQDLAVSIQHCKIFLYENQLCIQDLDSINGTTIKKRWGAKETLYGTTGFLYNKSKIWLGNTCFLVIIFYYEMISE